MKERPYRSRRSELSVPADRPEMIEKASRSDADLVFIDLEDAVPAHAKAASRKNAAEALNDLDWSAKVRAVRVNNTRSAHFYDDIEYLVGAAGAVLDIVILPKVIDTGDVMLLDRLLTHLESQHGVDNRIGVEAMIEEAPALARVEDVALASDRLEALIFGPGDLAASLGTRRGLSLWDQPPLTSLETWAYARSRIQVAARAAGIAAVDCATPDFRTLDTYRREALWAATMGFSGKWAIHPNQIPIANEAFSPTPHEVEVARAGLAAARAAGGGDGAFVVGSDMADAATVRIWEGIMLRAGAAADEGGDPRGTS